MIENAQSISRVCDYRHIGLHTKEEQERYLLGLDAESLKVIEQQVQMYKAVREYSRMFACG